MRVFVLSPIVFGLLAAAITPAAAADFRGDMTDVRAFLDLDKSYSPNERVQAEAAFAELKASAADMSPAAFQLAVAHIAALTRNGHTMLVAGVWANQFNRTPLRYHVFADGTRVVHAPESMRDLLGARVTAIDGHGIEGLKTAFGQYFGARDGKRDEWVGFFLESPAILHAAGFAKADDRVEVQFELSNGAMVTRMMPGAIDPPAGEILAFLDDSRLVTYAAENVALPAKVPLYLSTPGQAFRFEALPELDAYFMQFRINKSYYEQKIEPFLASAGTALREAKPKNIIVDLRLDGGGDLNTTRAFLQELPSLTAKDGRIFVLTSGRTFSAGISSAGYLKQAAPTRVTIVGEPVGDNLEFWAEGDFMQLPGSKAVLLAATERHNYMTGCQEADCHRSIRENPIRVQSLEPDIAAPLTYADYRQGRDPALAAVRQALGR